MIPAAIHWQGALGLAGSALLGLLLVTQKAETRHWRKQSGQFEQLYRAEQTARAGTIANYRAAAAAARHADQVNAQRVAAEQRAINERTVHDFQARLAAARAAAFADARRLRHEGQDRADPGSGRTAAVPGLPAAARAAAQAAGHDRLSHAANGPDWRLTATEQAIQLDELIKWVRRQHAVEADRPDQ